jgi:ABC-2 type transport system ATP-binding protein
MAVGKSESKSKSKVGKPRIVEVEDLVKRYKKAEKNAVDGVDFYVEEGAFFSLLGPNGAGKTTILSILNTTLSKTEGRAMVCGFDVDKQASRVRESVGVIFQNPSLDLNLTAEENVRFHANLYGLYAYRPGYSLMPDDYQMRVEMLAGVLGLEKDIHKPVKALSGGMKRKLEIVRSLMHSPRLLFLDEPTTGLDPVSRRNLWNYLQEVRDKEKTTIFLTTHYLEEAEGSDYVCIIDHGRVVSKGTPEEIKEALVEEYLEVDSKNRDGLKKEIKAKGWEYSQAGPFRIALNGESSQEMIKSIDSKLSRLRIHKPSLEQAYLKIIEDDVGGF